MTITAHVYQIYIAASPEQVWTAITDSAWTSRYFHSVSFVEPLVAGRPYATVVADGSAAVDGMVEELTPPAPGVAGRFVQTWHVLYDAAMAEEPPSRVEWTVEEAGDGLTRVRLVHGDLAQSPLTWANVRTGWVWVLDGMKTLLETGSPLPPRAEVRSGAVADSDAVEGDWHRRQGAEANNAAWDLIDSADRTDIDEEDLLRTAYAAAYHWQRAAGATPANEARADYLLARALLATGQPAAGLRSADRCLAVCTANGLADFDLAFAHEARFRALSALDRPDEAAAERTAAISVVIANPGDREVVEREFASAW
jgi:uncharacterized protein YndB with AHSA1/START domain